MQVTVLASTTHEVPHECLKANDLSGGAEYISERLVQCNIARGHSEMRDTKDCGKRNTVNCVIKTRSLTR